MLVKYLKMYYNINIMSRAGRKAFDKCNVKVVEILPYIYSDDEQRTFKVKRSIDKGGLLTGGSHAILHCPRTEDKRVNAESEKREKASQLAALDELRRIAGEMLCRTCMYSSMTPVEVSVQRKDFAEAEAERITAFAERDKAISAAKAEIELL